jgi:hypothetical protein
MLKYGALSPILTAADKPGATVFHAQRLWMLPPGQVSRGFPLRLVASIFLEFDRGMTAKEAILTKIPHIKQRSKHEQKYLDHYR